MQALYAPDQPLPQVPSPAPQTLCLRATAFSSVDPPFTRGRNRSGLWRLWVQLMLVYWPQCRKFLSVIFLSRNPVRRSSRRLAAGHRTSTDQGGGKRRGVTVDAWGQRERSDQSAMTYRATDRGSSQWRSRARLRKGRRSRLPQRRTLRFLVTGCVAGPLDARLTFRAQLVTPQTP